MSERLVRIGGTAVVLLVCGSILAAHAAKPRKAKEPPPASGAAETQASTWPAAELTVGFQLRDSETEGIGDLLIPIWNPGGNGLLFINPRSAITDHSAEEFNLGIGYRQLLPRQNIILGVNAFYDYRDTRYDHYDQWGAGFEILSTWVDARANYYEPENKQVVVARETETTTRQTVQSSSGWNDPYATGHEVVQDYVVTRTLITETFTRTFEQYQKPLGGHDWEIGLRLPIQAKNIEARVFAGYYDFDRDFGDDVKGWKARAEVRLNTTLFLDAGIYENDELTGSDWFAGARLAVPLDLAAVSRGRNPFAGAKSRWGGEGREFSARLTEMVMRDPQIRLETSKMVENKALATEDVARGKIVQRVSLTLLPDAMFVDGDAPFSGDGSAEFPFTAIQTGANHVFGAQNVYVFNASGPYNENVVLQPGTTLWGSGVLIPGHGGKSFGSGIAPIVDGQSMGPSITMANQTTVKGFHVRNTEMGGPSQIVAVPGFPGIETRRVGIFGSNATDLTITQNILAGNEQGALLLRQGNFNLAFSDNMVRDNSANGLLAVGVGNSGIYNVQVENSQFIGNLASGANLIAENYDLAVTLVTGSLFANNGTDGLGIVQDDNIEAMALISGLQTVDNGWSGAWISQSGNGLSLIQADHSVSSGNGWEGFELFQQDSDLALANLLNLQASGNQFSGVRIWQGINDPNNFSVAYLIGVEANNNAQNGVQVRQNSTQMSLAIISDSEAHGNQSGSGFALDMATSAGNTHLGIGNTSAGDNALSGFDIALQSVGNLIANLFQVDATGNAGNGMALDLTGSGGLASVQLSQVTANENAQDGVNLLANRLSGGIQVDILDSAANNNVGDGFDLDLSSLVGPITVNIDPTEASFNQGNGILLNVAGLADNTQIILAEVTTHDNTLDGVNIAVNLVAGNILLDIANSLSSLNSLDGYDISLQTLLGAVTANFTQVDAYGNDENGIRLNISGGVGDATVSMDQINASYNAADGILANIGRLAGAVSLDLSNATALSNARGLTLTLNPSLGAANATLTDVTALGNAGNGLTLNLAGVGGGASAWLERVTSRANAGDGIRIAETYTGAVSIGGERLVSTGNAGSGVYLSGAGLLFTLDFGGGGLGSAGQSSIHGNSLAGSNRDFRNAFNGGLTQVKAENNWWGQDPPVAGQFSGSVDRNPALGSDPN